MPRVNGWVHKVANVLDALPKPVHDEAKQALAAIYSAPTRTEALEAVKRFADEFSAFEKAAIDWRMAEGSQITIGVIPAGYFNNLSFHRIVPNFVIQGGSPGANEYMGQGPFMRDEVGRLSHRRGTVGISTRGRDTGDAQIFINLVDNLRLDFDYTVFGEVIAGPIERILEGDTIREVRFTERQK